MRVAIIGAAGYLGGFLVDALNRAGITPTVVTRPNGSFLLADKQVTALSLEDVEALRDPFDVVVNLAYASGKSFQVRDDNLRILAILSRLGGPRTRYIHASSLAVFGFGLEHPVQQARVAPRPDWPYVEGKLHFEHELLARCAEREVHIVRLGNVWGPGSLNWTVPLLDKVLYGLPTAVRGHDGFSNATDVANAADYLVFLVGHGAGPGAHFHHLAELSELHWSFFLERFSALFGQPIAYLNEPPPDDPGSAYQDLRRAFSSVRPSRVLKDLYESRIVGSYVRHALGRLSDRPVRSLSRLRPFSPPRDPGAAPIFLRIMSCPRRFASAVDPRWRPPLSPDQSWRAVLAWIDRIELSS